jgi:hypothetical protein
MLKPQPLPFQRAKKRPPFLAAFICNCALLRPLDDRGERVRVVHGDIGEHPADHPNICLCRFLRKPSLGRAYMLTSAIFFNRALSGLRYAVIFLSLAFSFLSSGIS